jgi:hypothetical protein
VDGLLSDRSFGGGKAVLKRGLVVYVPLNPAPVVVAMGVFDDVGKMKALVLLTEASRQVMMRREIMIAVDVCSNIYLLRSEYHTSSAPRLLVLLHKIQKSKSEI